MLDPTPAKGSPAGLAADRSPSSGPPHHASPSSLKREGLASSLRQARIRCIPRTRKRQTRGRLRGSAASLLAGREGHDRGVTIGLVEVRVVWNPESLNDNARRALRMVLWAGTKTTPFASRRTM